MLLYFHTFCSKLTNIRIVLSKMYQLNLLYVFFAQVDAITFQKPINILTLQLYVFMCKNGVPRCLVGFVVIFSELRTKELAFYHILPQQNSLALLTGNVWCCTHECTCRLV